MTDITKTKTTKAIKKSVNPRSGMAVALTFFAISIFLYFQPKYFDVATVGVSLASIIIGFAGLGSELNKISSGEGNFADDFKRGAGIFDNTGYGIALLILWGALYYYFPIIWVNVIISPILLFAIYGIILGLVNGFFDFTLSKKDLDEQKIAIEAKPENKEALLQYNTSKYYLIVKSVVVVIVGTVGFVAALLQALQILKIIP
jgi:hypothetical protein